MIGRKTVHPNDPGFEQTVLDWFDEDVKEISDNEDETLDFPSLVTASLQMRGLLEKLKTYIQNVGDISTKEEDLFFCVPK